MLLFIRFYFTVEDIADNVGLKAAFHAFTNWMSNCAENLRTHKLPALDLTRSITDVLCRIRSGITELRLCLNLLQSILRKFISFVSLLDVVFFSSE